MFVQIHFLGPPDRPEIVRAYAHLHADGILQKDPGREHVAKPTVFELYLACEVVVVRIVVVVLVSRSPTERKNGPKSPQT